MKAKFIKAVEEGDIISTRLFISNEMMLDPRGKSFHDMISYAESKLPNLYDSHDGKDYSIPEEEWNEAFLFSIKNDLDTNFSQDRLSLYEKVAKVVLKEKAENLEREEAAAKVVQESHDSQSDDNRAYPKDQQQGKKKLYEGLAVGGAVVAVVGLCASKAAIATLGFAGLVIGGTLLYKEMKK